MPVAYMLEVYIGHFDDYFWGYQLRGRTREDTGRPRKPPPIRLPEVEARKTDNRAAPRQGTQGPGGRRADPKKAAPAADAKGTAPKRGGKR